MKTQFKIKEKYLYAKKSITAKKQLDKYMCCLCAVKNTYQMYKSIKLIK